MQRRSLALIAGGFVSVLAPAAMSACIYNFSTDKAVYDVSDGPVTVHVYLTEILTDGTASFADADDGIAGVQLAVTRTAGDIAEITSVTRNTTSFTDTLSSITFTPVQASVNNILNFSAIEGVKFNGAANSTTSMFQADITIGLASGASPATFSVNVPGAEGGYVATYNGTSLDVTPTGGQFTPISGTSFQVVVPEPSTVLLLAASSLLLGLRRRAAM